MRKMKVTDIKYDTSKAKKNTLPLRGLFKSKLNTEVYIVIKPLSRMILCITPSGFLHDGLPVVEGIFLNRESIFLILNEQGYNKV